MHSPKLGQLSAMGAGSITGGINKVISNSQQPSCFTWIFYFVTATVCAAAITIDFMTVTFLSDFNAIIVTLELNINHSEM